MPEDDLFGAGRRAQGAGRRAQGAGLENQAIERDAEDPATTIYREELRAFEASVAARLGELDERGVKYSGEIVDGLDGQIYDLRDQVEPAGWRDETS